MKFHPAAAAVFLALAACAPRATIRNGAPPEAAHIKNVPFYPNTTDQCGPAALASVLNFWGKEGSPEVLKEEIYLPRVQGTLPIDMRPALEKRGLDAEVLFGTFDDIKEEIRHGRPVIAYLDFGTRKHPIGHFLVVTGFDDRRKGLIVHSAKAKDKFAAYRRFERGWKDTDRWMLVASPATADVKPKRTSFNPNPVVNAPLTAQERAQLGAAYESQGLAKEAKAQYEKALALNGNFEPALIGLGNLSFEAKEFQKAAGYYKRVLKKNPNHGGANNNLAMVYLTEGKNLKRAESYARRAAGTEYHDYACDTLRQIYAKRGWDESKACPPLTRPN